MAEAGKTTVLRRKLTGRRDGAAVTDRSALRALRLGLARAAGTGLDLPLAVIGAAQSRALQPDAVAQLDEEGLIVVLDGPNGARGAIQLDRSLATGIVQQQTMGVIGPEKMDDPTRKPTATDAALVAPLIDDALKRAEDMVEVPSDKACLMGFRFGAQAESVRSLALGFVADRYRVFNLNIDVGAGQRKGQLTLILPEPQSQPAEAEPEAATQPDQAGEALLTLPTALTAELTRFKVSLSEVAEWKEGDVLPLPVGADLSRTRLVSPGGEVIAELQLGQARGARALRLRPDPGRGAAENLVKEDEFTELETGKHPENSTENPIADDVSSNHDQGDFLGTLNLDDPLLGDGDDTFGALTPEEAVAEISELAGLPAKIDAPS